MDKLDETRPYVRAYAPGRTELAGNHTDHQGGRVVAATVDCGLGIEVQPSGDAHAIVESEGFDRVEIQVGDTAAREAERGTTVALVRGVIAGLQAEDVEVPGFVARVTSSIPAGGGLSSSAAFELALAHALICLAETDLPGAYGAPSPSPLLPPVRLAEIAQASERGWFGKPCGLMDQLSIALGGINEMDFSGAVGSARNGAGVVDAADTKPPVLFASIDFDFERSGYALFLVDTHCDHSRYTREYAQVAHDMDEVARYFGAEKLSHITEGEFLARIDEVRHELGDLPALRGLHYYREMRLVDDRIEALKLGDVEAFLVATRRSGASSAQYLQNVSTSDRREQPAMIALALVDHLAGSRGAARIHGGGFGGTIQAFVPIEEAGRFAHSVDDVLGAGSCKRYRICGKGAHAEWVK